MEPRQFEAPRSLPLFRLHQSDFADFASISRQACSVSFLPYFDFRTCSGREDVCRFDSPPCVACDFQRRRKQLGLDVALQMWLRAVKRDIRISLAVPRRNATHHGRQSAFSPPCSFF
eukprot:s1219_g2.t1